MSSLNSLLSSIGGNPAPPPPVRSQPAAAKPPQQTGATTSPTNGTNVAAAQTKRKAEGDLNDARAKALRREQPTQQTPTGSTRPSASLPPSKTDVASTSSPLPYRGTARPTAAPPSATKPLPKPTPTVTSNSLAAPKPAAPSASTPTTASKKTGYAAILERAKAAQEAAKDAAAIKHKPIERLTKKERQAQEAEAAKLRKERKLGVNGRSRSAEPQGAKAADAQKDKRKPVDLGYKGTMRPAAAEPAYKGTMNLKAPARRPGYESDRGARYGDRSRSTSVAAKPVKEKGARYAGYASYSENDSEDEEDYDSEASSDMEAGAFDLDEEEQASLAAAKKEDLLALQEENELKRKKLERKKMLQKMAAEAARKKRY